MCVNERTQSYPGTCPKTIVRIFHHVNVVCQVFVSQLRLHRPPGRVDGIKNGNSGPVAGSIRGHHVEPL